MSTLLVRGGTDADGQPLDVRVVGGEIAQPGAGTQPDRVLDAEGLTVLPGLLDLQVNGAVGLDLTNDPRCLWEVAAALPAHGVTAFAPTVITAEPFTREAALAVLRKGPPAGWSGAAPLGLHFEGPMIAPARVGAHPPHLVVAPSLDLVSGWTREAGVLLVTLAPELPGALAVI
jgi:N-acetylglucosamine-6-phosphate deacetylase